MARATKLERLEFLIGLRDQASGKVAQLRRSLTRLTDTAQQQFMRVGTGAMAAFGSAMSIKAMVSPAIDFNRAMGEVASLGLDGEALDLLGKTAKQFTLEWGGAAADVVRAASDIQGAINGLSGQELSAFTIASGVLATASRAQVGTITDYMATMYGVYQEQADKMGRVEWANKVAGQTAQAINIFKTDGPKWAQGISALGASATAAGIAMEEQFAVLGNLQLTMGGSEAATKYRAFLTGALRAGDGLNMSFFNADGTMNSVVEIMDKLRAKFGATLGGDEKLQIMKAFGSDEAVSFIDLLYNKTDALTANMQELAGINDLGPAREMARKMTDIWGRLGGVINVIITSFGQALLPALEAVGGKAYSALTTVQRWITIAPNLARWVGYGAIVVVSLAGAMGLLAAATAIGHLAMMGIVGPFKMAFAAIGFLTKITGLQTVAQWLLNAALWANPMTWVVVGIIALIAAVAAVIYWWDDLKAAFLDTAWGQAIMATIEKVIEPFKALGEVWDWLGNKLGFGGKTEVVAKAMGTDTAATKAAIRSVAAEPPAPLPSIEAPRVSQVPVGGVVKASLPHINKTNTKQTSIGQVTINTERPLSPGELVEFMALQAG